MPTQIYEKNTNCNWSTKCIGKIFCFECEKSLNFDAQGEREPEVSTNNKLMDVKLRKKTVDKDLVKNVENGKKFKTMMHAAKKHSKQI